MSECICKSTGKVIVTINELGEKKVITCPICKGDTYFQFYQPESALASQIEIPEVTGYQIEIARKLNK